MLQRNVANILQLWEKFYCPTFTSFFKYVIKFISCNLHGTPQRSDLNVNLIGRSQRINSWIPIYLSIDAWSSSPLFIFLSFPFFLSFMKHPVFSSENIGDAHKGEDTCVKLGYFGVARIDLKLDGNSYEICFRRDHFISFRFSSTNRGIRTKYWMTDTHARRIFFISSRRFFRYARARARAHTHTHTHTHTGDDKTRSLFVRKLDLEFRLDVVTGR